MSRATRSKIDGRTLVAEAIASAALVAIALASGLAGGRGSASVAGAIVGSLGLGLGLGLIVWTLAPLGRVHTNPAVTALVALAGAVSIPEAAARVVAQLAGALIVAVLAATAVPAAFASGPVFDATPAGEAMAGFSFGLVALSIAPRRSAVVPLALGACVTASFWATGSVASGNPIVLAAVALARAHGAASVAAWTHIAASASGLVLGAALAAWLRPPWREAAALLLFAPRAGS